MDQKRRERDNGWFQRKKPRLFHNDTENRNPSVNPVVSAISGLSVGKLASGPGPCCRSVDWKINNFFSRRWRMNDYIDSPTFSFHDETWFFRMYPNGETEVSWIDVYLLAGKSVHVNRTHRIQCKIGIRKKDGSEHFSPNSEQDLDKHGLYFHFKKIISRTELVKRCQEFAVEGGITVFCSLSICSPETWETTTQSESNEGFSTLVQDLKNLLLSGEESDLTIIMGDRKFKCHRAILATRSSVFATMLKHGEKECNRVIEIEDCEPKAFWEFLVYLYSGSLKDFSEENAFDLYHISEKYNSQEVKTKCIHLLTRNLTVENICKAILSMPLGDSELQKIVVSFFAKNVEQIIFTAEWEKLMKTHPLTTGQLYLKALNYNATRDETDLHGKTNKPQKAQFY